MLEAAKKVREPVAWMVIAGIGLGLVLRVVGLIQAAAQSAEYGMSPMERSGLSTGEAAILLLVGAACSLLAPRARRATAIAWAAFAVVVLGILSEVGFGIFLLMKTASFLGAGTAAMQVIHTFAGPLALAGVAWALSALAKGEASGRAIGAGDAPQGELTAGGDPRATTWHPDQASGAAWSTASGAASGAQASGWGVPGERGGWTPNAQQPNAQQSAPALPAQDQRAHRGQPGTLGHQGQPGPQHQPANQGQPGPQHQPSGPHIIYPDAANDTTQFRGQWDPRPRD